MTSNDLKIGDKILFTTVSKKPIPGTVISVKKYRWLFWKPNKIEIKIEHMPETDIYWGEVWNHTTKEMSYAPDLFDKDFIPKEPLLQWFCLDTETKRKNSLDNLLQ